MCYVMHFKSLPIWMDFPAFAIKEAAYIFARYVSAVYVLFGSWFHAIYSIPLWVCDN